MNSNEFDLDTLIELMRTASPEDLHTLALALSDERLHLVKGTFVAEARTRKKAVNVYPPMVERIFRRKPVVGPFDISHRDTLAILKQKNNLLLLQSDSYFPIVAVIEEEVTTWIYSSNYLTDGVKYSIYSASTAELIDYLASGKLRRRGWALFSPYYNETAGEIGYVDDESVEAAMKALAQLT